MRSPRQWLVTGAGGETLLVATAAVAAIGLPSDGTFGQRWPVVALTAAAIVAASRDADVSDQ
ncbi:MAG: hypothetical protein QOG69_810 [Actinomycetota bacterium]|jgi:hypothetical protein|nr:hypothetical protein [Actinomycetota bacterium]